MLDTKTSLVLSLRLMNALTYKSRILFIIFNPRFLGFVVLICAQGVFAASNCSSYLNNSSSYSSSFSDLSSSVLALKISDSYLVATEDEVQRSLQYQNTIQSRSPKIVSLKKLNPENIDTLSGLSLTALGFIDRGLKPMLGVLVKTMDGQMVLALGSYIGGSHQDILKELSRKFRLQTILWVGELLVSTVNSKLMVHVANETSDFIGEYIKFSDRRLYGKAKYSFDFLRGVKVGENKHKWLKAYLKGKQLLFSTDYQGISFDLDHERLLPLEIYNFLNLSYEFKNQLVSLMAALDLLVIGKPSAMDLVQIKLLIQHLQSSAKYFLHLSHNLEDEVLIKKINLFLAMSEVFVTEVQDFSSLNTQDIKDFQALILTVSKASAIHSPNPITSLFIKSAR